MVQIETIASTIIQWVLYGLKTKSDGKHVVNEYASNRSRERGRESE